MRAVRFIVAVFAVVGLFAFAGPVAAQDRDCPDFPSQAAAQAVFNQDPYNDPYGLDGPIGPGFEGVQYLACESNAAPFAPPFSPPAQTPTPSGTVAPSAVASGSPRANLPGTGAADGMIGLVIVLGVAMLGAGVVVQRRMV
jgi:hypothetical protein